MESRGVEIRRLNRLTVDELVACSGGHLLVLDDIDGLHRYFAGHMADLVESNNACGRPTAGIFPFGPVGQYPYFIGEVNRRRISLASTWFFFMDEYAGENGVEVSLEHPLSFRGKLSAMFRGIDRELLPDYSKIVFPLHENIGSLAGAIASQHLDVTYGGIGIHGHLAFNEPEPGVRNTGPRLVTLNDYTVTINSIREGIGGNIENFPRQALTLGMNQLFAAKKIVLFCRNGSADIDWANTVLRLALLGTPGDDYPVTYVKQHPDWLIVTDRDTVATPISI